MFKLERALKTYREAGALNAQVLVDAALPAIRSAWSRPSKELSAFLSTEKQVSVMGSEITRAQALLDQKARSFVLQVADSFLFESCQSRKPSPL